MYFILKNITNKGEIIMLKTLKGKVVAGVAAVLLLAGGTAALRCFKCGRKTTRMV